jgi:hypothetical protein
MNPVGSAGMLSKFHIFLGYRSVEARFADVLKDHIVQDFIGLVDVFLATDTTSIPAGAHWLEEIVRGLTESNLHVIICSSTAVLCPWIHYEAGAARVRGIPIVTLCHSGLVPDQLPVPLSESEGSVVTDASGLEKLYMRIADFIGSAVPAVDFVKYAAEFKALEEQSTMLLKSTSSAPGKHEELIKEPHVLCVTSAQFRELGYLNQLQIVLDAFPKDMPHDIVQTSADMKKILLNNRIDIIHVAAFVCPRGGDLYFSKVELPLGESAAEDLEIIAPETFVTLVKKAQTRLVVLGGSASLVLAAQLLSVTNVIAARDMVSARAMAVWVETFYDKLTQEPLAVAAQLASDMSQAPMKLYAQQQNLPSMRFSARSGVDAMQAST